jgi:alpha-amylase/alpha-mannosidase (GH57 family)
MQSSPKLKVVLCWHMHQPDYRDCRSGEFMLPWTYLHAIKDYADMAYHLENQPAVRAVFNFVPVLLDQIEDYADQFATRAWRDPLLRLLDRESYDDASIAERRFLLDSCFRANHPKMIEPFPAYRRLHEFYSLVDRQGDTALQFLSGQYLADLVTWYHLAWTGETVRRQEPRLPLLMEKGVGYTRADRVELIDVLGRQIRGLIPRYRALAEAGRIELACTPYQHPIVPLLIDLQCAREMLPDAPMPTSPAYPGGHARAQRHLDMALRSHQARFGIEPAGVWPAEGAVSTETARLVGGRAVSWIATGEGVLANSLQASAPGVAPGPRDTWLYRPYVVEGAGDLCVFFRDDDLSDRIGFEYSKWFGRDAAVDFSQALSAIHDRLPHPEDAVVSVILDGENPWESYPYNGYYFLEELYGILGNHPKIELSTFAQCARRACSAPDPEAAIRRRGRLSRLVAGSWVYGNLATWIGSTDKNKAWDLLCDAKRAFDRAVAAGRLSEGALAAVERQLSVCEASDWCWWFGDYNPAESVASFDRVYRRDLSDLYRLIGEEPPDALLEPVSLGRASAEHTNAMRRASA